MKFKASILLIVLLGVTNTIYGQIDTLDNRKIYNWKLNSYDLKLELVEVDTSLVAFQNFNPILTKSLTSNYLGNLGTAAQSKIYYDRKLYNTGFIFSEPYGIYLHLPQEQLYYNTKRQFTLINYSNAGPKEESEQVLGVLHTQNVNKDFNVGVDYDMISSDGRYLNQEVKQNKVTLFSSYQKKGYRIHTNLYLNKIKAQENGGIDSLHYLGDDDYKNRRNIPVRLEDARNEITNTGLYLAQEYRFGKTVHEVNIKPKENINKAPNQSKLGGGPRALKGKSIKGELESRDTAENDLKQDSLVNVVDSVKVNDLTYSDSLSIKNDSVPQNMTYDTTEVFRMSGFSFSHELSYNNNNRKYIDDDISESFYENRDVFIDSTKTHDEVRQKQFANKLSLNYKYSDKFSIRMSLYNEQMKYEYNISSDTSISATSDTTIKNNIQKSYSNNNASFYMRALLFNQIYFSGYGEYYISGYKKENSKLDLKFAYIFRKNTELSFEGEYTNHKPDYFYKNFSSNHFNWQNDYLRNIEEWNVGFAIRNNKYKFYTKAQYGQISNHLYLDSTAYVNQYRDQINILSAELSKTFKLGPINSVTRFVYQKATEDSILALPEYNLYQSLYFERLTTFKSTGGELLWQVGVDYRYASSYIADGYMPTTGMFYRQFDHTQEDYHCFDVFINIRIKRARFYLKYQYLNSMINEKYYFTGPFYPSPEPLIKFGLAWTFYD